MACERSSLNLRVFLELSLKFGKTTFLLLKCRIVAGPVKEVVEIFVKLNDLYLSLLRLLSPCLGVLHSL